MREARTRSKTMPSKIIRAQALCAAWQLRLYVWRDSDSTARCYAASTGPQEARQHVAHPTMPNLERRSLQKEEILCHWHTG